MTRTKPIYWDWRGAKHGNNWPRLGVRDGKWKLLMTLDHKRVELYDMTVDLAQRNDMAGKHPGIVKRLAAQALAWRETLPTAPPSHAFSSKRPKN